MQSLTQILVSDKFWFIFLHIGMILLFLFALHKDLNKNKFLVVGRGEGSRKLFIASAGALITFLISIVFQISNYPKDGKVLFYLLDLILISYLCIYSPWFTNRLVMLKISFEERKF